MLRSSVTVEPAAAEPEFMLSATCASANGKLLNKITALKKKVRLIIVPRL
jgi:hypothetical protein